MLIGKSEASNKLGWDVIAFLALYIIMPSYFAIELSSRLPLITISRGLLVLIGLMLVIRKRTMFCVGRYGLKRLNLGLSADPILRWCIYGYAALMLLVNCTFLRQTNEALNQIFITLAEELALLWIFTHVLDTREKITSALRILVLSSGVVAAIAAVSCMVDYNLFYLLKTTQRDMPMANYYRLNLLRAEAGFGHPVYYGAYCAVMIPLGMYLTDHGKSRGERLLYAGCIVMNLVGLVLSNSRGSMLAFACLVVVIFFLYLAMKSLKKLFATYLPIGAAAIAVLVLITALSPVGVSFLKDTASSLMDSVLPPQSTVATTPSTQPSQTPPEDATEPTQPTQPSTNPNESYGKNQNGLQSRLVQLTGVTWTLMQQPVFGFGPNAHIRGLISYQYVEGYWTPAKSLDSSIVSVVCQYGLVGLLAHILLYGALAVTIVRKKYCQDKLMRYLGLAFVCYMLCLLSISMLHKMAWILFALIVCTVNILRTEQAAQTDC